MELEDQDSEIQAFDKLLAELKDCEQNKADGYGALIKTWEAEAEAFATEIKRMEAQKKARLNKVERLKYNLELYMQTLKIDRIEGTLFKLVMQKNTDHVVIDNESLVPDRYKKTTVAFDKVEMKKDLKSNGASPYAHLEQSESVRIK